MTAIVNVTLVMADHLIPQATLLTENGIVTAFGQKVAVPEDAEIIDGKGLYLGPGLVDIHTHAGGEHWFNRDPVAAARHPIRF